MNDQILVMKIRKPPEYQKIQNGGFLDHKTRRSEKKSITDEMQHYAVAALSPLSQRGPVGGVPLGAQLLVTSILQPRLHRDGVHTSRTDEEELSFQKGNCKKKLKHGLHATSFGALWGGNE